MRFAYAEFLETVWHARIAWHGDKKISQSYIKRTLTHRPTQHRRFVPHDTHPNILDIKDKKTEDRSELSNYLLSLEERLLIPEIRKSGKELEELLSDDFLEIRSTGVLADKEKSIVDAKNQPSTEFELGNFHCKLLSSDIALTKYELRKSGSYLEENVYTIRTSIWKRINNKWQIVFHQGAICKK